MLTAPCVHAGFEAMVAMENARPRGKANGGNMIVAQPSERSLLSCLLARLQVCVRDFVCANGLCVCACLSAPCCPACVQGSCRCVMTYGSLNRVVRV